MTHVDSNPWRRMYEAALDASYPGVDELEADLPRETPYAFCPTCDSQQEIDFALDGSGVPYCCECGTLDGIHDVRWVEDPPEKNQPTND